MKRKRIKRIGIMTGGGDCPGLNAAIRAVAKAAINTYKVPEIVGILDGFEGLMEGKSRRLQYHEVSRIVGWGGTILGTSNRCNPFRVEKGDGTVDLSDQVMENCRRWQLDALVVIGGEGTLYITHQFFQKGLPVVGVPKTIDNDIYGTDVAIGFDSAVDNASRAIDRIQTTAESHHRVMIIETMGRNAGWIALHSGLASGADIILIPELPYDLEKISSVVRERNRTGKRFSIIVVAEGAYPAGGSPVYLKKSKGGGGRRLGGIGRRIADDLSQFPGIEARFTILGHLLRGGGPTASDRMLATRFGVEAMHAVADSDFGKMVAQQQGEVTRVPMEVVSQGQRLIPKDHSLIQIARSLHICFGD